MTAPTPQPPTWIDDFAIPADAAGAILALNLDDDSLWAARLSADGTVSGTVTEPRIDPRVLDVRIAGYLRDGETVDGADDPAVFAELLDVCRRARGELLDRDSTLVMGTHRLRLVTVTLDTVVAATMPELNRAHGMLVELAGREPVAAVLLGPGTDAWPGLWESLTERGFAPIFPGDPFPVTYAADDTATGMLEALDPAAAAPLAWAAVDDPAAASSTAHGTVAPARLDRSTRTARRTRIATAAAAAVIALTAVVVAITSLTGDDDVRTSPAAASEPTVTAVETGPAAPTTASPADLRAARAPMLRYRPPVTTATETATETATQRPTTGPRPTQPRPNPRRTIPNPIPGLPPIVIG